MTERVRFEASLSFRRASRTDLSAGLSIIVDRKVVGEIKFLETNSHAIWRWQIEIDGDAVANGAALSPASAQSAVRFAWRGYARLARAGD